MYAGETFRIRDESRTICFSIVNDDIEFRTGSFSGFDYRDLPSQRPQNKSGNVTNKRDIFLRIVTFVSGIPTMVNRFDIFHKIITSGFLTQKNAGFFLKTWHFKFFKVSGIVTLRQDS